MTPDEFVIAVKNDVRDGAASEADYYESPQSTKPPEHLARFSQWFQRLSSADREIAKEVIRYSREGCLFSLLTFLDNLAFVTESRGTLELWYIGEDGSRLRLNDPDGELLTDLFNNTA